MRHFILVALLAAIAGSAGIMSMTKLCRTVAMFVGLSTVPAFAIVPGGCTEPFEPKPRLLPTIVTEASKSETCAMVPRWMCSKHLS